jgi:hypothetical protein
MSPRESQYKKKISKWHLDKKVKGVEMEIILRKQAKHKFEGKDSSFSVRGQAIEPEKIDRYKKRKNVTEDTLLSQQSPAAGEYCISQPNQTLLTPKLSNPIRHLLLHTCCRRSSNTRYSTQFSSNSPNSYCQSVLTSV